MILGQIFELKIVGVFDRGLPNNERIGIYVNQTVNMGEYGLLLGVRQQENTAFPLRDNFFWFGEGYVNPGDWIFVYTGPGYARQNELPGSTSKLYSVHWGRDKTVLHSPEVVPVLIRIAAVEIPEETRQGTQSSSKGTSGVAAQISGPKP